MFKFNLYMFQKCFYLCFLAMASILLQSCDSNKDIDTDKFKVIDIKLTEPITNPKYSLFIKDYEFVPLETTENSLIGRITKILTTEKELFILDSFSSKGIFVFDRKGKFLRKIGSSGTGPGYYQQPMDFILDKKQKKIHVLDNGVKVLVYNFNGKYLTEKRLKDFNASYFEKLDTEHFAWIQGGIEDHLLVSDSAFNKKFSKFPYTIRSKEVFITHPFQKISESLFFRKHLNDTIYQVTSNEITPYLILNYGKKSITRNDLEQMVDDISVTRLLEKRAYTLNFYQTENHLFVLTMHRQKPIIAVHNKRNNQSAILEYLKIENDITFEKNTSYVIGVDEVTQSFIFFIESAYFLQGLNAQPDTTNQAYQKASKLKNTITKESNPIIMLATFKDDF